MAMTWNFVYKNFLCGVIWWCVRYSSKILFWKFWNNDFKSAPLFSRHTVYWKWRVPFHVVLHIFDYPFSSSDFERSASNVGNLFSLEAGIPIIVLPTEQRWSLHISASATIWCTVMEVSHSDMSVTAVCNHGNIYMMLGCCSWVVGIVMCFRVMSWRSLQYHSINCLLYLTGVVAANRNLSPSILF